MRATTVLLIGVAMASGCSSKSSSTGPDAATGPHDAAALDAAPVRDAAAPPVALTFNDGVGTIAGWLAPDTYAATTNEATLFVYNTSGTTTGTLALSLAGADAASYTIDPAATTCGSAALVAGDGCWVGVQFAPTATTTTAQVAYLVVVGAGSAVELPLSGATPVPPTTGLVANVAYVDFATTFSGGASAASVILTNDSSATLTLGARTAPAPFSVYSDNCPATLTPGGSCTVNLIYTGSVLGLSTAAFTTTSSANTASVPLRGVTLRTLQLAGTDSFGSGTVASLPVGVPCGGRCIGAYPLGVGIALTALPAAGNLFAGWGGLCSGTAPTCAIASPAQGTVDANFVPNTAKQVVVTFAGTAHGWAFVTATSTIYGSCTANCTVYVPVDAQITLYGYSPSTFAGWTGDCTATTAACNLGTVTADRAVTITDNPDANEVGTLLPATAVTALAVAPGGNIVVGSSGAVTEYTPVGATVWTTAVTGGATGLAIDASGDIYGANASATFALTSAGAAVWSKAFGAVAAPAGHFDSTVAASPDGTVIAVLTADGVHVVDGSGTDRFTITGLSPAPQSVAVAATGTVALTQYSSYEGADVTQALRYTSAGAALATWVPIPDDEQSSLAFDATGAMCTVSTGEAEVTVTRETAALAQVFSKAESSMFSTTTPAGIAVDPTGEVVVVRGVTQASTMYGMKLEVFSAAGAVTLTQTKTPAATSPDFVDGVSPLHLATGGTNRLAVGGVYGGYPWIQIYDLP